MRFFLLILVIVLVLVKTNSSDAQQIVFNHVSPPEGSYGGLVSGITQDKEGFMWFATYNGLHRYDGYHFISYYHNPSSANSLAGNWTLCVLADRNAHIWVGTFGNGLDRFDAATGAFMHFRNKLNDPFSLSGDTVICLLEDHEGTLWVGTTNGLNRLNQKTGKFTRYQFDKNDSYSISNNVIRTIYEDKDGTIWIGTGNAFFIYNGKSTEGGLNQFNKKTGKFTHYKLEFGNIHSLIDGRVSAIFEDSRGGFWVGTYGDGLHIMNKTKGEFERHLFDPAHPEKLSRPRLKKLFTYDDHITFITEDAVGAIWIGTLEAGINRYDPKTKKITHYESGNNSSIGFKDKSGWCAYTSNEGVLWVSTWEGPGALYRIDPFHKDIKHYFTGDIVWSFQQDASGVLWAGTQNGLFQINRDRKILKTYLHDSLDPHSLSNNIVGAVCEDQKGKLWVGTMNGLNRFDRNFNSFTRYLHDPQKPNSLDSGYIYVIYEDRKGSLWLGTDKGLDLMDTKSGTFIHYHNNPKDTNSLKGKFVTCIKEDRLGFLWVGTGTGGVNCLDKQTGKFKHYLNGESRTTSLLEDLNGNIWVGSTSGIYRYDKVADSFYCFIDPRAGMGANTNVNWILEDNQNNIWLAATERIFKLNKNKNEASIYGRNYGVNGTKLSYHAGYLSSEGEIFCGDGTGYYAFFPKELISNSKPPQIVLTDFKVGDNSAKPGKGSPLSMPLSRAKEIRLKYNQNVFSFEFAGIHFSSPQDNRHLFMLESYDNTWRKPGEEKTAYYKVTPGRYVFRVKAANTNGVWAEISILIIVNPPWYKTWWFYTLTALIIITVLYALYRYRINQILQIQKMRARIATDLHDDIGSTLTSISYYSELVKMQLKEDDNSLKPFLDKIGNSARNTISSMSDIVWIINPNNDTTANLINRMKRYAAEMLGERNIQYSFNTNKDLEKLKLDMQQRKNIYLIYKEAIHNAVKYSQSCKIEIDFAGTDHEIRLSIKDNGKGFDILNATEGNGLTI